MIGVLIGSVAVWILARKVTTPIQELVTGAKAVGSGRLEHRFSIDAKDEFGQVARSLNQMLDNLSRSREALGESEELAWALLDATHDAVILMDRRGVILATNEIAAARFGKSLEQVIDETIYDIVPQATAASLKAHIVDVIRSVKPVHYEEEREGKIIDQNMYPVLDGKGEISRIAIFSRDITMRKWVEDVTEQLGRRNDLILEAAGEGIYGLDIQGKTTFVNPSAAQMLRYKPEELIGQHHHELVHHSKPDGKPYYIEQCPIYTAFKDGAVHTNVDDEVFWRKDGTSFPVEYTSTPIIEDSRILGAVVTFKDITERKRVEKALLQSEEKYRSIFEAAASLIVSVDKEGIVIDCNTRIQQILGYLQSEIIERRLVDIFHPDEYSKIEELLNGVLIKGFEYDNRYIMLKKDGTSIKISMNAAAATDTNGEYVRTICMINIVNPGKGLPLESSGQGERSHV
ncbi:PAS domain S-box protein [Chloroflexota bacterium]